MELFMKIVYLAVIMVLSASLVQAATFIVLPKESIQGAIFAARSGDLIVVKNGTYYEHLKIDKPITLEGDGRPVLDATSSGSAVTLTSGGAVLRGFKIVNAGGYPVMDPHAAGIRVLSSNNTIADNFVVNNFVGIRVEKGSNNSIYGNVVSGNLEWGIVLEGVSGNTIFDNRLQDNYRGDVRDAGQNRWEGNSLGNSPTAR
jgi:nitrous oxidase accessory protein